MRTMLVLVLVLGCTVPVGAECAWVVWHAYHSVNGADQNPYALTGYSSMEACEERLRFEYGRLTRGGWTVKYAEERTLAAFKGKGEAIKTEHYRCLPAGVDVSK